MAEGRSILTASGAVPLGRRMLWGDRARFFVTAAGVGVVVALLLFLFTVYEGAQAEAIGYVSTRPVDAWVSHRNSTNLVRSVSYLPEDLGLGLETVPGVARASPLLRVIASTRIRGEQATFFIFGIDPASPVTRPEVVAGSAAPGDGELLLDRAFARKHRLGIGDTVRVQDRSFRVAGLSAGTNALVTHFGFSTLDDGQRLLGFDNVASYFLVEAEPGVAPEVVTDSLRRRFDEVNVFTAEQFVRNNVDEMRSGVLPLLWSVTAFGTAAGAAVLTLLLYGAVLERRADYALLKAIGAGHRWIDGLILRQALLVVGGGLAAGVVIFGASAVVFRRLIPEITFGVAPWVVLSTAGVALVLGLAAAWLPIHRLRRVYPGEVFRP